MVISTQSKKKKVQSKNWQRNLVTNVYQQPFLWRIVVWRVNICHESVAIYISMCFYYKKYHSLTKEKVTFCGF